MPQRIKNKKRVAIGFTCMTFLNLENVDLLQLRRRSSMSANSYSPPVLTQHQSAFWN